MLTARDVLPLRDQGLSNKAIAAQLGLTKGQVSGLIFRARSPRYREVLIEAQRRHDAENLERLVRKYGTAAILKMLREIVGA